MKILIDENLSPDWVATLRNGSFEARHWSEIGSGDAPDDEIIVYAASQNCVVLTQDLDFGIALARMQTRSPSVVQLRSRDVNPNVIGQQVIQLLSRTSSDLESGVLLTIDTRTLWRVRATLLPIRSRL